MLVRFGYVAIALDVDDASPNKTTTVQNLLRLPEEARILKLSQLAQLNLHHQLRILKYNAGNNIMVFRLTSKLVPLATHDVAAGWNYATELQANFREVGDYIREHHFRVSFHPDHFVNLNSPKKDIFLKSVEILRHHYYQSRAMGLGEEMKFNIHVGGAYQDKVASLERFIENWAAVPVALQKRITLENDDKTFTARETLACCQKLGIPMVLDVHHHRCNREEDSNYVDFLEEVFWTWRGTGLAPKVHVSSPRGQENSMELRSHADFIDLRDVMPFLTVAQKYTDRLDVMIEAKQKDLALKQLMREIQHEPNIEIVDGGAVRVLF